MFIPFGESAAASLTIQTNKPDYSVGELVVITGRVSPSSIASTYVGIEVDKPDGSPLFVDQVAANNTGLFSASFRLSSDVKYGKYVITAVYEGEQSETTFNVLTRGPVVTLTPNGAVTDEGIPITIIESISNGTAPFSVRWFVNGQPVPGSDASFSFVPNSSGTFLVFAQITDGAGYVVESAPSTITVNTDPVLSSYISTGQSTNFFLSNNIAQSKVDISGGTRPYVYDWYLNGLKVAQTSELSYKYTFSSMGPNLLQVIIFDAAGFHLVSEPSTIDFGLDFLHLGVVVVIVVIALYLVILRLWKAH